MTTLMNAKEKQAIFVKSYLKMILKQNGYQTSGQTWWKDKGDFFNVINLQNYSWSSKEKVDFCFNIGIALKATVKDVNKKKATYNDLTIHLREGGYLPDRVNREFGNNQGYSISEKTDVEQFIASLKTDFELYILPKLEEPKNLVDCLNIYERVPYWGDNLKRVIAENKLL